MTSRISPHIKAILIGFLSTTLVTLPIQAETLSRDDAQEILRGNEFMSGNYPRTMLMPVKIWGSVSKPGIHYVPEKTDLSTLLSLSGGPNRFVELDDDLIIKRRINGKYRIMKINLEKLIEDPKIEEIKLKANDIVFVPFEEQVISDNALRTISLISSIVGMLLSAIIITDRLSH